MRIVTLCGKHKKRGVQRVAVASQPLNKGSASPHRPHRHQQSSRRAETAWINLIPNICASLSPLTTICSKRDRREHKTQQYQWQRQQGAAAVQCCCASSPSAVCSWLALANWGMSPSLAGREKREFLSSPANVLPGMHASGDSAACSCVACVLLQQVWVWVGGRTLDRAHQLGAARLRVSGSRAAVFTPPAECQCMAVATRTQRKLVGTACALAFQ